MQRAVVKFLRLAPFLRDVLWSAWPNGGKRDRVTAALMKAEGVNPGPLDLWFFSARKCVRRTASGEPVETLRYTMLVLELKAGKNGLTAEQRRWRDGLIAQGACVRVVTDDVAAACGVVKDYFRGIEPAETT
jgi:hypothetical protein